MKYVVHHSTLKTNLISWWEMNETSGTRYDAHGTNHLTANGTGGVASVAGKINNAADLESGDADYFSITDASQTGLDNQTNLSFSYWIKLETDTDAIAIAKFDGAGADRGYWLQINVGGSSNQYKWQDTAEGDTCIITGSTMTTGVWYHHVWTFAAGVVKFYVDGSYVGTDTCSNSSIPDTAGYFSIGRAQKYASNYIDGAICQVGAWSKELTSDEVTDLYNAGDGMMYGIAYDTTGSGTFMAPGTSGSFAANVGSNPDRVLWVAVVNDSSSSDLVTALTYNSVALTKLAGRQIDASTSYIGLWYLVNPTSGSNTLAITTSSSCYAYGAWASYVGFPSTQGVIGTNTHVSYDTNAPITLTVTTEADYAWTISAVRSGDVGAHAAGTGVTERSELAASIGDSNKAIATAGSSSMTWDTIPTNFKITGLMGNFYVNAPASTSIKTVDGLAYASVKTINGLAIASVKTVNGLA